MGVWRERRGETEREKEGKAMNERLKVWSCRKNRRSQQNRERERERERDNSISLKSEEMDAI